MSEKGSLEQRVVELSEELQSLCLRVAQLETKLGQAGAPSTTVAPLKAPATVAEAPPPPLQAAPAPQPVPAQAAPAPIWIDPGDEPEEISEEILNWADRAHLFTRASTLCFLMVVALILRTVTDNNLINTLAGSGLGMGYAALLMGIGAYRYENKSPLAPIFAATGAALMATIVLETHSRFASLPLVPAYLTLIATGVSMAWLSYRHQKLVPISLGTLGMCLSGAAIDYPHPFFPYLALVLFAANILGYFAAQLKSCSWLRWIVLVVTMAMLQLWGVRLGMVLLRRETPPAELALNWFLPALGCFALLYLSLAVVEIVHQRRSRISRFNYALPTLNALWALSLAAYVSHAWWGSTRAVGFLGLVLAIGHVSMSGWLAGRRAEGAPGTNSFAFAAVALAAISLPFASGFFLLSLPVVPVAGFFLAIISRKWENRGIRFTSYLAQLYGTLALGWYMYLHPLASADLVNALPAGLLAVISLYHYQWARRSPPPTDSPLARYDRKDRSATALLLGALVAGFVTARISIQQVLVLSVPAAEVANALQCAQSVLINLAAGGLMLFAFQRKNKEIRNVAILVTLIGAVKVFLYDLLGTHGVPLVASVFSFGLAAAIESIALGKWRAAAEPEGAGAEAATEKEPPKVTLSGPSVREEKEDRHRESV